MKFACVTFGCRTNRGETQTIENGLIAAGTRPAASLDEADVVVVNTCSVTSQAEQDARQALRRIAARNPSARVIVTGCYATRAPEEVSRLPHVGSVLPNDRKFDAPAVACRMRPKPQSTPARMTMAPAISPMTVGERGFSRVRHETLHLLPGTSVRTVYTLVVQTGCDESCSYCVIPSSRGRSVSRPMDGVMREAEGAERAGYKEIVLAGVHLGSFGRDLSPSGSLAGLLEQLADRWPHVRYRLSSLEPMDVSGELVDLIASRSCIARHFHLPIQHASDAVLGRMRRPYRSADCGALVASLRRRFPDAALGADVMVGFPGETKEDFDGLISYLEGSSFTHLHVFRYSPRPGTDAARYANRVPAADATARAQALSAVAESRRTAFARAQVGRVLRGLTIGDGSIALTDNYLKVKLDRRIERNEWVRVRVTESTPTRGILVQA